MTEELLTVLPIVEVPEGEAFPDRIFVGDDGHWGYVEGYTFADKEIVYVPEHHLQEALEALNNAEIIIKQAITLAESEYDFTVNTIKSISASIWPQIAENCRSVIKKWEERK